MSLYGFAIHALPVGFLNFFIVLIDLYYLKKIYFTEEYFSILTIRPNSFYLKQFLSYYKKDIEKYIPEFNFSEENFNVSIFILRNMVPAGLFLGKKEDDGTLNIELDFVIPEYRDFKIGRFLFFKNIDFFKKLNITSIKTTSTIQFHMKYLEKMGFKKELNENDNPILVKLINN